MKKLRTILVGLAGILAVLSLSVSCHRSEGVDRFAISALDSLDRVIEQRSHYMELKEERLGELRARLETTEQEGVPLEQRYRSTLELA